MHAFRMGRHSTNSLPCCMMVSLTQTATRAPVPLRACRYHGRMVCLDNRRLYYLKTHQDQMADDVMARAHAGELNDFVGATLPHPVDQ